MEINIESKEQFLSEIKSPRVLVDFYATWCGPCKMLSPIISQVAEEHPEIKVLRIDVDEVQEIAAEYNIFSIPTLYYFENGEVVRNGVGFMPKPNVLRLCGIE